MVLIYGNMLWLLYGSGIFYMTDLPWTCIRPLSYEGERGTCSLSVIFSNTLSFKNPSQKLNHSDIFSCFSRFGVRVLFCYLPMSSCLNFAKLELGEEASSLQPGSSFKGESLYLWLVIVRYQMPQNSRQKLCARKWAAGRFLCSSP